MQGFYWRLIARQGRLSAVRLFVLAVMIATSVTFGMTLLSDRLEQVFNNQSREVLAADILLRSTSPVSEDQLTAIRDSGLQQASTTSFQTMVSSGEAFLLAGTKAVSDAYPLRGELQVADELYGESRPIQSGPQSGEVWVEDRVLNEMQLKVGDPLSIGDATLTITQVIVYEPDRGSGFYSFTPRVMMNEADLPQAKVLTLGSRATYSYLMAGDEEDLTQIQQMIEPTLKPNQQFVSIESANQTLAATLDRAYRFLNITALIAVLLGAVAVALVSFQYAEEMTHFYAVLRCLGLRGLRLKTAVAIPFIGYSVAGMALGLGVGALTHQALLSLLAEFLPKQLPNPSWQPFIISVLTAGLVIISFAAPFLYRLINASPKTLLAPSESRQFSMLPVFISLLIGIGLLVFVNVPDVVLSTGFIGFLVSFLLVGFALVRLLLWLLHRNQHKLNMVWRIAVRLMNANRRITILQILALSIAFFSILFIHTLRNDLLTVWQDKIPQDAPNYFVINLFEEDMPGFRQALSEQGITRSPIYPVVRGRLVEVNGQPIRQLVSKDTQAFRATDRDLSLTFADQPPVDNEIISGEWSAMQKSDQDVVLTSIESELAEGLGVTLGDELLFVIEAQTLTAKISSIRSVDWQSFQPNFYFMFSEKDMAKFPRTYLGSFYLPEKDKEFLTTLVKNYRSASFFDVDFLVKRIRGITLQVGLAVESILYFALLSGMVIFLAIELILRQQRRYVTAIIKSLGGKSAYIEQIMRVQFLLVGLFAGLMALMLNTAVSYALFVVLLEGTFVMNWVGVVGALFVAPLLIYSLGLWSLAKVRHVSAKSLLVSES